MNDNTPTTSNEASVADPAQTVPFDELVELLEKSLRVAQASGNTSEHPREEHDVGIDQSDSMGQHIEDFFQRLDLAWQQRAQLSELESELSRRIQKLTSQKKSLSRKFRAEWKKLEDAKQDLLEQQPAKTPDSANESFDERTRKLAQSKSSLVVSDQDLERLQPDELGRTPAEVAELRTSEVFELKRQLEQALSELHLIKSTNVHSISDVDSTTATPQGSSWEDMKQSLINDLESESSVFSAESTAQLAETVRHSQQLIQQKDKTIQQLETLLGKIKADLSKEGFEARKCLLDENKVVASEIERLNELQQQWRERIGQAEVELSHERARLARERSELDQQIERLQEAQDAIDKPETPRGRKWLEHLGLD